MKQTRKTKPISAFFRHLAVIGGAIGLTLLFFLVLPIMQTISEKDEPDTAVQTVAVGEAPPPPPVEPEIEEPPPPDETPPELVEDAAPLDLASLELGLTGSSGMGMGMGAMGGATPPRFSDLDANGDGVIDAEEFSAAPVQRMSHEEAFANIDADGSGDITEEELEAARAARAGAR